MKRSFVKCQSLIFDSLGKFQKDMATEFGFCPFFLCLCAVSRSAVFAAIPLSKYDFRWMEKFEFESPRILRRRHTFRRWRHEQEIKTFSPEVRERTVRIVLEHRGE